MKIINIIEIKENQVELIPSANIAGEDWLRAGHLKKQAQQGNKQSKLKLDEMENDYFIEYSNEEIQSITSKQ